MPPAGFELVITASSKRWHTFALDSLQRIGNYTRNLTRSTCLLETNCARKLIVEQSQEVNKIN